MSPRGLIAHHTATRPTLSDAGLDRLLMYGYSSLPGPLCHLHLTRSGQYRVVASGVANHAGRGSWRGVTGNRHVIGIEAANDGRGEPWPQVQRDAYDRGAAAILDHLAIHDGYWPAGHKEWAPGRKIDPLGIDMAAMRVRVSAIMTPDMSVIGPGSTARNAVRVIQRCLNVWQPALALTVDGIYGPATRAAVESYQSAAEITATGLVDGITLALLARYDRVA